MKRPYRIALRNTLLAVLSCAAMAQVQAFNITSVETRYVPGGILHNFQVNNWSMTDPSPSPCEDLYATKNGKCRVTLAVRRSGGNANLLYVLGKPYIWTVPSRRKSSMGAFLLDLMVQGFDMPFNGSVLDPESVYTDETCIGFVASPYEPGTIGAGSFFGHCQRVKPPMVQCEVNGNTTIDHKSLPDNALDGATASLQLNVQCKGQASVTVSASRSNSYGVQLRSDGSLYSKITLNGKDATNGINVPVAAGQPSPLNVTSTLSTRGTVTPGSFSGSTVITVSPP
ncbi:hypothetical protein FEM54_12035 [Pseudomonas edaphica]|uniref:Fimbrial adhesin MrpH C-terminal domain-containing protein n=1 Tax=Pseudomonas edaphica TaxID=2006980 RepID=A0ABY2U9N6_9PSED|nr:hypothetical protein [Pseudomonas edaphica]TLG91673.1 hypothetical protein FEM54_12035 [Pseudomonas edaphica]